VKNNNKQGEYYLPDVIPMFIENGKKVSAVLTKNFDETRGINTIAQLIEAETILHKRGQS
jgi:bifunctional UDP-N-acetylglucosamine pyrophosphorylase/glucosamine-1-phosphate N-acetyltransferase